VNILPNQDVVVALDCALNKTGLAILSKNEEILHTQLITVTNGWEYYRKIRYLYEVYSSIFEEVLTASPKSSILVLEGRLKAGWSGTALASIEGARITAFLAYYSILKQHEKDVSTVTYDPNGIKGFIAGKRNANKELMRESALSRFSLFNTLEYQEDIYDAIYIALYHLRGTHDTGRSTKNRKVPKSMD
jgi:Holliday junction resolvasome RuvABC endonuclease subunit